MKLIRSTPAPRAGRQPAGDPALADFRARMGAWAEGKSDRELAELKHFADWVITTSIAITAPRQPADLALARARKQS